MEIYSIIIAATLCSSILQAQDRHDEFLEQCGKWDTTEVNRILGEWEKENPDDPELLTSYFNYFYNKSQSSGIGFLSQPPEGESLEIQKQDGSAQMWIGAQTIHDANYLNRAFAKINKGIRMYPDRLDMRFGKIHTLGELGNWEAFTAEIIKTIDYSNVNDNQWLWTYNEKRTGGASEFLDAIQDYQLMLYDTNDDGLLINMKRIGEQVLKYHPEHIESLTNISVFYLVKEDYKKAIDYLAKAESVNPKDAIVLSNIAFAHMQEGNKEKAIDYYTKTKMYADRQLKSFADEQIEILKK